MRRCVQRSLSAEKIPPTRLPIYPRTVLSVCLLSLPTSTYLPKTVCLPVYLDFLCLSAYVCLSSWIFWISFVYVCLPVFLHFIYLPVFWIFSAVGSACLQIYGVSIDLYVRCSLYVSACIYIAVYLVWAFYFFVFVCCCGICLGCLFENNMHSHVVGGGGWCVRSTIARLLEQS